MSAQDFDIVIAGGGMVGAALACALGNSGLNVALVEGTPLERIRPTASLDLRVSAISRASQRIIEAVGAWERISDDRVGPFRQMQVWDAVGDGSIQFDSAALGEPSLGWIIENRVLQTALLERAQTFSNITLLCPAALIMADGCESGLQLRLEDGRELQTRLLVGADGAQSQVRQWANITVDGWSYAQKAVVTIVGTAQPHQEIARQRFLPTGPLAFLPLHDGRCGIVWSTLPERADSLLSLDDASFAAELAKAFEWRLGKVTSVGPRATFPLRTQHAQAYVKPHFALIGDAAHVVHPLAGQGVNLGLLDA
ncbi:MAG: UbiH/UbiF/VisC/COQ6 family ubiquinone biosynthesis hydroxylase, partial [Candidatus Competibacteraceae bacterium]|nr:UbiH/UbiF/VisC/COQ6 family ubiquinone biosynthesis hydroxylase [Candidatus Competibacteraceae bacterium]